MDFSQSLFIAICWWLEHVIDQTFLLLHLLSTSGGFCVLYIRKHIFIHVVYNSHIDQFKEC